MKRVRMLLRVSSNQQLEADGDLTIQRQIVKEYIEKNKEWQLDKKEYFEGSNSGYKNSVANRDILQQALTDAKKKEYDILVAYKDDRIGRLMWEIGSYVMQLKSCGVEIYTVKDGCISPESDDIMGQMVLALRYGSAQKSSYDTSMRVKDTAQKLVQKGKFMGGAAPYGYELVYSGEISKHGRALKRLQIIEEKANVVKYIYELSLNKEYGSSKIAKVLNEDSYYSKLAPIDFWKAGTITSILTNPIYSGHVAYKRRERINGRYLRLNDEDWIKSEMVDESISIINEDIWNLVQKKRKLRNKQYTTRLEDRDVNVIMQNTGELPLIDIMYCGYCGCKLTNGSRYNYWTIKSTGEKRASKHGIYKCSTAWSGIPHEKQHQFRRDKIEPIIFEEISKYLSKLLDNLNIRENIDDIKGQEIQTLINKKRLYKKELDKITKGIESMEEHIPDAVMGEYALSVEQLSAAIKKQKAKQDELHYAIEDISSQINIIESESQNINDLKKNVERWEDIFLSAKAEDKRVIVNQIIKRIEVKKDDIKIIFKYNLDNI